MSRDKLVRDRIPQIIRDNGEDCRLDVHYRKADPDEMRELLETKLQEEVDEYLGKDERDPSELVDILEVLLHLASHHNMERSDLERLRKAKLDRSGGFWDRWVLFGR